MNVPTQYFVDSKRVEQDPVIHYLAVNQSEVRRLLEVVIDNKINFSSLKPLLDRFAPLSELKARCEAETALEVAR